MKISKQIVEITNARMLAVLIAAVFSVVCIYSNTHKAYASTFFTASFPGSEGQALPAGWHDNPADTMHGGGTVVQDGTGGVESNQSSYYASEYNDFTPTTENYAVNFSVDALTNPGGSNYSGILLHSSDTDYDGYQVLWAWQEQEVVLNAITGTDGGPVSGAAGTRRTIPFSALSSVYGTHNISASYVNGLVTVTVDGTNTMTLDDTASPHFTGNADKIALLNFGAQTATTGAHVTNLSATYNVMGTTVSPSFSLAAGSYAGTQSVTLSSSTNGAAIRYTTDGTTPTSSTGTVYSGAISVAASETIKAIAYENGYDDSSVSSAAYTITGPVVTTTLPNALVYSKSFRQDATDGYLESNASSGNILFGITGSSTVALKETSAVDTKWQAYVDGVAQTAIVIPANTSTAVTLASGIATTGVHQITLVQTQMGTSTQTPYYRWGSSGTVPTSSVEVNDIVTGSGSTVSASTVIPGKLAIWMTDSLGEYNSSNGSGSDTDSTKSFPYLLSKDLGWYDISRTFGGQTYYQDRTGSNIAPPVYTPGDTTKTTLGKWDFQNNMTTSEENAINYVVLAQGTNDEQGGVAGATLQTRVEQTIIQARAVFPNAQIIVQSPLSIGTGSDLSSYIQAGFTAANVSNSAYIPVNASLYTSYIMPDGVHLTQAGQAAAVANDLLAKYQNATAPTVSSIAVSPTTATVAGGASETFGATVSGTNSPSQVVTWSATGGYIDPSTGHFIAPAATSSVQTITVTATATVAGYTAVTGTATVTIPATVVATPAAATVSAIAASTSATTATISWQSSVAGSSVVNYGVNDSYGTVANGSDAVTSHTVSLQNLQACVTYHFQVVTTPTAADVVKSGDYSFTTKCLAAAGSVATPTTTSDTVDNTATVTANTTGSLKSSDSNPFSLTIPVGAVTGTTVFQYQTLVPSAVLSQYPAPSGMTSVGSIYDLKAISRSSGSLVSDFSAHPLTLTMSYDPTTLPKGINVSSLSVFRNDGNGWVKLSSSLVRGSNQVTATVPGFSFFGLFASQSAATPTTPLTVASAPATPNHRSHALAIGIVVIVAVVGSGLSVAAKRKSVSAEK